MPDAIVVGAGAAGLAAARRLTAAGRHCVVLEAASSAGGRVRTDTVGGFRLDRGFHVLLPAAPDVRSQLDLGALDLRPFEPGALVRRGGRFHRVADPLRDPLGGLQTLLGPLGTVGDKLGVLAASAWARSGSEDGHLRASATTTRGSLRRFGFSADFVDAFWRPFLGGVFFDPDLTTSSRLLALVLRWFAAGPAAVPARGIGEVTRQLADGLPDGCVRPGARVVDVATDHVRLEGGERVHAPAVVLAVDGPAASRLLGAPPVRTRSCTTAWYAASRSPVERPLLVLDGERSGPVNHLAVMSDVASTYAPAGAHLIAATSIRRVPRSDDDLDAAMRAQLSGWFGGRVHHWRLLRVDRITEALPEIEPRVPRGSRRPDGLYVAGDATAHASLQGALQSGRLAAEAVLADRPFG